MQAACTAVTRKQLVSRSIWEGIVRQLRQSSALPNCQSQAPTSSTVHHVCNNLGVSADAASAPSRRCSSSSIHTTSESDHVVPTQGLQTVVGTGSLTGYGQDAASEQEPLTGAQQHWMKVRAKQEQQLMDQPQTFLLQAALVGAPNAGKSSLVNALAGRKVGAVSHKSNTTVTSRLATFELGPTQVALYDTPGVTDGLRGDTWNVASGCTTLLFAIDAARQIETPDPRVTRFMRHLALRWQDSQLEAQRLHLPAISFDGLHRRYLPRGSPQGDHLLPEVPSELLNSTSGQLALESGAMAPDGFNSEGQLQGASASEGSLEVRTSKRRQLQPGFRAALVLNKCDAVREPGRLLDLARRLSDQSDGVFEEVFMTSVVSKGPSIDDLRSYLFASALPSPWLPADTASDVDMAADLAVEIVREEIFRHIHAELPYELQPIPTESRKLPDGNMMLRQSIFVRTILQRGILVGAKGAVIGRIGIRARDKLQRELKCQVHLYLRVLVRKSISRDGEISQLMAKQQL